MAASPGSAAAVPNRFPESFIWAIVSLNAKRYPGRTDACGREAQRAARDRRRTERYAAAAGMTLTGSAQLGRRRTLTRQLRS